MIRFDLILNVLYLLFIFVLFWKLGKVLEGNFSHPGTKILIFTSCIGFFILLHLVFSHVILGKMTIPFNGVWALIKESFTNPVLLWF